MMRAMTLIKERAWKGEPLSSVLEKANDELCARNSEGMFVTLFIGVLDLDTGRYQYACAGHNPPYVCRAGSTVSDRTASDIPDQAGNEASNQSEFKAAGQTGFEALGLGRSVPLGIFEEETYQEEEICLRKGERIFLYTDGVTEAMDEDRRLFEEERMQEVLNAHKEQSCREMLDAMKLAIAEFAGEMEQSGSFPVSGIWYSTLKS